MSRGLDDWYLVTEVPVRWSEVRLLAPVLPGGILAPKLRPEARAFPTSSLESLVQDLLDFNAAYLYMH